MQGESVYCLLHLFDRSFSPHHYVGFLASVVHSRLRPSVRLLRITHNSFTHNSFTHNSFTHNSFTQFFPHDFVTHNSSHTTLRTQLSALSHTQLFTRQALHLVTSTLTLRGRGGTYSTGLARVARLFLASNDF